MVLGYFDQILILLALVSQRHLGRWLGACGFFTSSLVGVALVALPIGILANLAAGLIRPFAVLMLVLGLGYQCFALAKEFREKGIPTCGFKALILPLLGVVLFLLNDPSHVFIQSDGNQVVLDFNAHHSYYSSQSVEMLRASYLDRLKVADQMPFSWVRYHFFSSSTQALAQGLMSQPGLFSYYCAELWIAIFILLSFGELFSAGKNHGWVTWSLYGFWFVIGLGFFSDTVLWHLKTNGIFSLFAMVHLIFALSAKKPRWILLCLFVLGASAFRLMPLVLVMSFAIGVVAWREKWVGFDRKILDHFKPLDWVGVGLFGGYNLATFMGPSKEKFGWGLWFDTGWTCMLASLKWLGLGAKIVSIEGLSQFAQFYNYNGSFNWLNQSRFVESCLVVGLLLSFGYLIYRRARTWPSAIFLLGYAMAMGYLFSRNHDGARILLVSMPYFLLSLLSGNVWGLWFSQISAVLYLYNHELGYPSFLLMMEVMAWATMGVWGLKQLAIKRFAVVAGLTLICFSVPGVRMMQNVVKDRLDRKVNITPLLDVHLTRSDWVDENGYLISHALDAGEQVVYAAILGAHLLAQDNTPLTYTQKWRMDVSQ